MKKVLLVAALAVFGFSANAQGFKAGINANLPIGDAADASSFGVGVDLAYTFEVGDGFEVGLATGYLRYFAEDVDAPAGLNVDTPDAAFVPVAATAKYAFSDMWFAAADLGYAVNVSEGEGEGGFLYMPKIGWQSESVDIYAFYRGISISGEETTVTSGPVTVTAESSSTTIGSVGIGFMYKF